MSTQLVSCVKLAGNVLFEFMLHTLDISVLAKNNSRNVTQYATPFLGDSWITAPGVVCASLGKQGLMHLVLERCQEPGDTWKVWQI